MLDLAAFIEDLARFVAFDTTVGGDRTGFFAAEAWVEGYFAPGTVEVLRIPCGEVTSLVIKPLGSRAPRLVGDGHLDIVPGLPDQFRLHTEGDWLVGRGTADMKSQVLVMMEVLRQALAAGTAGDFWLVLTEDEEVGSRHGLAVVLQHLAERQLLPPVVLAPDGGHDFAFVEKEKGILQFEVHTAGRGGHASRPFLADNALERLVAIARRLRERFGDPSEEADWISSLAMTRCEAGDALNRVPDHAVGGFDLRFTESDTVDTVSAQVRRVVQEAGGELRVVASGPATHYPRTNPGARRFLEIVGEATGRPPRILHSAGASNGRLYVERRPDTVVLMTSPCAEGHHGHAERVRISALPTFFDVVWQTVHSLQ